MYYHHILSRDENETIYKIYKKQKEDHVKGDWFQLLQKDFDFIGIKMDEEKIKATSKSAYKRAMKLFVRKAAFQYFLTIKDRHKKQEKITYNAFRIQPYLQSKCWCNDYCQI